MTQSRQYKEGLLGSAAEFRWPISVVAGIAIALCLWTPLPSTGELGFLGVLLWGRILGLFLGIAVTLVGPTVLFQLGTYSASLSLEHCIALALRQFRSGSRVSVQCPMCNQRIGARSALTETGPGIQLTCACGKCNSTHSANAGA